MSPEIRILAETKLMGKHMKMSYAKNTTSQLWKSFMPTKKLISNAIGSNLHSMQIYPTLFQYENFNPNLEFTKWAAIEVTNFNVIPEGLETYTIKGGLYAVFLHQGPASAFYVTFTKIFTDWLPKSEYEVDDREHFELLGEKYSNTNPNSEEEIWIPIKLKKTI
jgi:AraC family transcriptional regulator